MTHGIATAAPGAATPSPLLDIRGLCVDIRTPGGALRVVRDVSLTVARGEAVGLVGESGSGKSTIGRCVAALQRPTSGTITILGQDITGLSQRELRPVRRRFGFVFQDPATSLNPRLRVGDCVAEPLLVHKVLGGRKLRERVAELLDAVRLPADTAQRYPHELSGGQRQRANLARALALGPDLLVADEPTSALDVSVQDAVLDLFEELQSEWSFACLFISHDLAVVDHLCDEVAVIFQGRIVEQAAATTLFQQAAHPYTLELLEAIPRIDRPAARHAHGSGAAAPAQAPGDTGCPYAPRCRHAGSLCHSTRPELRPLDDGHQLACHLPFTGTVRP